VVFPSPQSRREFGKLVLAVRTVRFGSFTDADVDPAAFVQKGRFKSVQLTKGLLIFGNSIVVVH